MAYLIDYVHTCIVDEWYKLSFYQIKIIEYCILQTSAFRFCWWVDIEFFYHLLCFFLWDKYCWPHMVMIFLYTATTSAGLFPYAAFTSAEGCYFLPVFAFWHFNLKIYNKYSQVKLFYFIWVRFQYLYC